MDNYGLEKLQHIPQSAMLLGLVLQLITGDENLYISKSDLITLGPDEQLKIIADAASISKIKNILSMYEIAFDEQLRFEPNKPNFSDQIRSLVSNRISDILAELEHRAILQAKIANAHAAETETPADVAEKLSVKAYNETLDELGQTYGLNKLTDALKARAESQRTIFCP